MALEWSEYLSVTSPCSGETTGKSRDRFTRDVFLVLQKCFLLITWGLWFFFFIYSLNGGTVHISAATSAWLSISFRTSTYWTLTVVKSIALKIAEDFLKTDINMSWMCPDKDSSKRMLNYNKWVIKGFCPEDIGSFMKETSVFLAFVVSLFSYTANCLSFACIVSLVPSVPC